MDTGLDGSGPAMSSLREIGRHGLLLVPLVFLGIFFFYPLLTILAIGLFSDGALDVSGFIEIATSPYLNRILAFTAIQAALSTLLTLALALPGAYIFTRFDFPGKHIFLSLSILPFVLPTIVVSTAFISLIGKKGLINSLLISLLGAEAPQIDLQHTFAIILIAHVFYNYPLALRLVTGYWSNQASGIEEAARVLGCHGWRLWWRIRLPVLRPILLAAALLVFIFTFTSFGVILILGGPRNVTLEVEIYRQTISFFNLPLASALAITQLAVMFITMIAYTRLQRRIPRDLQPAQRLTHPPTRFIEKVAVLGTLFSTFLLLLLPVFALVIRSVSVRDGLSLEFYRQLAENPRDSILFVAPTTAIGNSLLYAAVTTLLAMLFGLMIAAALARPRSRLGRWLDPLFMLPLAASAVILGLGYIVALDKPPLNLRTSWALIPIAHTLIAIPFVVRSVLPALRGIPPALIEAAQTLGAPRWRVWLTVELPLMRRSLIVGAVFAFTVSMGEFGATAFVARPETPTLPIVIYRLLSQPGQSNYGQALAMSVILMFVCAVSFAIIERVGETHIGEF